MNGLQKNYLWLLKEKAPQILVEFLNIYGTTEVRGLQNNALILEWAKECGVADIYTHDAMPWCALAMTLCAKRAGLPYPKKYDALRAKSFMTWGTAVKSAMLGDVLIAERKGGFHVCLYVAEDHKYFHVIGGNQTDSVNIMRIEKSRIVGIRRTPSKSEQPSNIRRIILDSDSPVSTNEV